MPELLTPDICVIGAGSGGLSVAAAAAAFGVPVVLVEKGRMGGDCLNTGCVPSKALIAAARHMKIIEDAAHFGIKTARASVDFEKVHAHVHSVIAAIAPNDSKERFTGLGVRVIEGAAKFKDRFTVEVGDIEIKARRFVVATGSTAAIPPIPGLADTPFLTNESVFDLTALPKHLLVIGGGPIGMELAQAFRRLGSQVTVLEASKPLAKDDAECAAIVLDQLAREGVVIRAGVTIQSVKAPKGKTPKIEVTIDGAAGPETLDGSHLLIAAGRRATVDGLDLEAAGIEYSARGIKIDKGLRTTNKRVYAVGDVAGGPQFTHAANYHAGLVIRNALFRLPVKARAEDIPWVTFTEPELAQVGLTEAEATKRRLKFNVLRWPYHENDRAQAERETHGHIKVITDRRGRILGATIVGAQAGELISTWTLAISQRLNIRAFTGFVVPYPTLAEIGKRAAITFFTPSLTRRWVRRIIGLLRRLG
ncbi:MAG: dihydrolipoamide dehydrogenase [Xanthobacteraceae bacterium]|nr:dihydrolipoamide dehydrogenase [Xanthobacteraceae bacterium]